MEQIDAMRALPEVVCVEQIPAPKGFEGKVAVYRLRYRSDDVEVEGLVSMPTIFTAPLPVIIYNRGGNREFGVLKPEQLCRFAEYGYLVAGSQYRGNCGGTGREEFGGIEIDDVIKLMDIMLCIPFVNGTGVYMAGHSRGGMTTYLACARDARIRAAAVSSGLADSFIMYNRIHDGEYDMKGVYQDLVGGGYDVMPEAFVKRSAVCWADKIIPPVLICQGTADWRVVPEQAFRMEEALRRADKEHKLIVYEGAGHALSGTNYIADVIAWFRAYPLGRG